MHQFACRWVPSLSLPTAQINLFQGSEWKTAWERSMCSSVFSLIIILLDRLV